MAEVADAARIVWFLTDEAFTDRWRAEGVSSKVRKIALKQIYQTQREFRKRIKQMATELHVRHRENAAEMATALMDLVKSGSKE